MLKRALICLLLISSLVVGFAAQGSRFGNFEKSKPLVGDKAPDLTLKTVAGKQVTLAKILQNGPVILHFGSFT